MGRVVEIEADNGRTILAEVTATGGGDVGVRDKLRLDDAKDTIEDIARWVQTSVKSALPDPPEKIGVEFGLKLAVKSGALVSVLAEASGEASLTVKLEWSTR